jgi:hypothetical protein
MLREEPDLEYYLTENVEPIKLSSKTDVEEENLAIPKTDKELPSRAKERTDKIDPV